MNEVVLELDANNHSAWRERHGEEDKINEIIGGKKMKDLIILINCYSQIFTYF